MDWGMGEVYQAVAGDIEGNRDKYKGIGIDPFTVFECPVAPDSPEAYTYE